MVERSKNRSNPFPSQPNFGRREFLKYLAGGAFALTQLPQILQPNPATAQTTEAQLLNANERIRGLKLPVELLERIRSLNSQTSRVILQELLEDPAIQGYFQFHRTQVTGLIERNPALQILEDITKFNGVTQELERNHTYQLMRNGLLYRQEPSGTLYYRPKNGEPIPLVTVDPYILTKSIVDDKLYTVLSSTPDPSGRYVAIRVAASEGSDTYFIIDTIPNEDQDNRDTAAPIPQMVNTIENAKYLFWVGEEFVVMRYAENNSLLLDFYKDCNETKPYKTENYETKSGLLVYHFHNREHEYIYISSSFGGNQIWLSKTKTPLERSEVDEIVSNKEPFFDGLNFGNTTGRVMIYGNEVIIHSLGDQSPYGSIHVGHKENIDQGIIKFPIVIDGEPGSTIKEIKVVNNQLVVLRQSLAYNHIEIYSIEGIKIWELPEGLRNKQLEFRSTSNTDGSTTGNSLIVNVLSPIDPFSTWQLTVNSPESINLETIDSNPNHPLVPTLNTLSDEVTFAYDSSEIIKHPIPIRMVYNKQFEPPQMRKVICNLYGGFGINNLRILYHSYHETLQMTQGTCFCRVGLPGGSEYLDPEWRDAGKSRSNVIQASIVTLRNMINTFPNAELVLTRDSNGGLTILLVLLELLEKADEYGDILSKVRIFDAQNPVTTLGENLYLTGESQYWVEEYGNPDDPEVLHGSPEHRLIEIINDPKKLETVKRALNMLKSPLRVVISIGLDDGLIHPLSILPFAELLTQLSLETNGKLQVVINPSNQRHSGGYSYSESSRIFVLNDSSLF